MSDLKKLKTEFLKIDGPAAKMLARHKDVYGNIQHHRGMMQEYSRGLAVAMQALKAGKMPKTGVEAIQTAAAGSNQHLVALAQELRQIVAQAKTDMGTLEDWGKRIAKLTASGDHEEQVALEALLKEGRALHKVLKDDVVGGTEAGFDAEATKQEFDSKVAAFLKLSVADAEKVEATAVQADYASEALRPRVIAGNTVKCQDAKNAAKQACDAMERSIVAFLNGVKSDPPVIGKLDIGGDLKTAADALKELVRLRSLYATELANYGRNKAALQAFTDTAEGKKVLALVKDLHESCDDVQARIQRRQKAESDSLAYAAKVQARGAKGGAPNPSPDPRSRKGNGS